MHVYCVEQIHVLNILEDFQWLPIDFILNQDGGPHRNQSLQREHLKAETESYLNSSRERLNLAVH